jgi:predicted nucleic acid-binding protein
VRGTLGILLDAKSRRLIERIEPWIDKLQDAGMWISDEIRLRILRLAGEAKGPEVP